MSFEDEDLDHAYKLLEGTEKFCDPSRGFSFVKSSSSQPHAISPHERLYRRSIIADCLLFEAILVFLKQGFTSYVKGGYILRKAWKLYDKLNIEVNQLCSSPSPIALGGDSGIDKHVGTSLYDDDQKDGANGDILEDDGVDALSSSLPGLLTGLDEVVGELEKGLKEGAEEIEGGAVTEEEQLPTSSGVDEIDIEVESQGKGGANGYELPDIPNSSIQDLDDEDARLRGGLYFGFGLMNVIVSLIPPKLIKVANLFGFHGSRKIGLQALEYSSHSQDMKAPLAR